MTQRQRPKRPSKASKAAEVTAGAVIAQPVAITGSADAREPSAAAAGSARAQKDGASTPAGAKTAAATAKVEPPATAESSAGAPPDPFAEEPTTSDARSTLRGPKRTAARATTDDKTDDKPPRKRTRSSRPPPPDATSPATPDEARAQPSIESATVAPPARATRTRSEPRVVVKDPTASTEEEIWTDGIGRGIEGTASRALRAADKAASDPAARLVRGSTGDRLREAAAFGSSQSLLSTDYYFRQYGAHGMRSLAAEVDEFGFDPHVEAKVRPLLDVLCKRYFRVTLTGAENLPANGRALLVANRSGALPWDGLVLRSALRSALPELCPLRWLAEDSVIHYPFMGVMMNRLGAVRACPENAERLLSKDRLVAVFPEGAQGSHKLFRDRYRLQRFGRGGYVKLALKFGVPILPTAIIGAEETHPLLGRSRLLGRLVGADSVPITPTFPWFGLAGLIPAPVKWRIVVGEPIDLSKHGPESADDALVVHRLNEQIRASLQGLVDQGKSARGSVLFG